MNYYKKKLEDIKKDPYQYAAYRSKESTAVIAGPGSGKTTVLTLKIMSLLQEQISPPRGLACVTYNRAAAKEFRDRLNLYGFKVRENVFLGTLHSFCIAEIIKPFAHMYDFDIPMPLKIISQKDRKHIFNEVLGILQLDPKELSIEEMDKERTLSISGISRVVVPTYDIALACLLHTKSAE